MTVSKAERLMNLTIMLLETSRPLTAREIRDTIPGYGQESYDSFKRMFERDKEALREVGLPVEMSTDVWGEETAYRIPKERYYLPEIELEPDEVASLWLAASLLKLQDPGTARAAMLKLSGDVVPPPTPGPAPSLRIDVGLSAPGLARAFEAVSEKKSLTFTYAGRDGEKHREVDAYGLLHRRGFWYLVGLDHSAGETRSFRLDRIKGPLRLSNPNVPGPEFSVPQGFRPEELLETPPFAQSKGSQQPETARIRFDASEAWLVERENPWVQLSWDEHGVAEATVGIGDPDGLLTWIFWYTTRAEILEPSWLRDLAWQRLREICG